MVKAAAEMPKNVLMDSEMLLREAFSGIAQIDTEEKRPFPDSEIWKTIVYPWVTIKKRFHWKSRILNNIHFIFHVVDLAPNKYW